MKKCIKCYVEIPTTVLIDGNRRNLQNRKYCLDCSPFGSHNTKKHIDAVTKIGTECECQICNKKYVFKHKGHTTTICASCQTTQARRKFKKKCVEYKGGKCQKCEYKEYVEAMEFHHVDPNEKDFGISNKNRKWELVKTELDKCHLLCCRCHREVHAEIEKEKYSRLA